jgi:hypothetical protein
MRQKDTRARIVAVESVLISRTGKPLFLLTSQTDWKVKKFRTTAHYFYLCFLKELIEQFL